MISVKKIWTIMIALSLSLLTYADTYYLQGVKEKDANGKEYLIFNDERIDIGLKIDENDKLKLVPIISKTDSISKQKKIDEKIEKEKKSDAIIQNLANNLLKLSITLIGMIAIFLIVSILCAIIWMIIWMVTIYKKS
jgi:hypothetical protein